MKVDRGSGSTGELPTSMMCDQEWNSYENKILVSKVQNNHKTINPYFFIFQGPEPVENETRNVGLAKSPNLKSKYKTGKEP